MGYPARIRLPATIEPDNDPTVQRLLEESRAGQAVRLTGSKRTAILISAATFLAVAIPFAILVPGGRPLEPSIALGLVALYAVAARIEFHSGFGWTDPTQLVFVPMLFLLPISAVPLIAAAAAVLFRIPEIVRGRVHLDRALVQVSTSWYALGPAVVLAVAGPADPSWADWPVYAAALGAQFAVDFVASSVRDCLGFDQRLGDFAREMGAIYLVDALLAPIGLLAAFAAAEESWAFLLVLPLLGLIAMFSRERQARIENALTLSQAYRGTAHLMGELLSTSDQYTGSHTRSVVVLAHQVGQAMELDESVMREVEFGALLHDVGKIAIPNELINKPGALDNEEWALMKSHTTHGADMLERIGGVLEEVGQVVRHHHERWDGNGYPDGLAGEQIPVAARVISVCDAFHAMTSDRSYRAAMPRPDAIEELLANAGSQFDPTVVEALVGVVAIWAPEPEAVEPRDLVASGV